MKAENLDDATRRGLWRSKNQKMGSYCTAHHLDDFGLQFKPKLEKNMSNALRKPSLAPARQRSTEPKRWERWKWMGEIKILLRSREINQTEFAVAFFLAEHANNETGYCFPAIDRHARQGGRAQGQ
jgi:hypothetical protein